MDEMPYAQALRLGKCDGALVAGVNLQLHAGGWAGFCAMGALSKDGKCKTFDAAADGYGRSEAVGAVVLKRLSLAQADSGCILGIVRGTAVNQDGKSASFMAPNGPSQQAVIRAALRDGGVEAHEVAYVETHGTGTALGDPMEVGALQQVCIGQGYRVGSNGHTNLSDCCDMEGVRRGAGGGIPAGAGCAEVEHRAHRGRCRGDGAAQSSDGAAAAASTAQPAPEEAEPRA